ncbi:Gfo/Idh/MocA family protein [Streptomyces hoynatensis]|uniref:Gfo/Idh/MocA family protein n=1 Tax=Streptomyces hoynatensis TaxID=1141874 RepID=UPI001319F9B3|nr:Gfo/Idh/MocA family oxidoreductase [Streptomyces hoynatensis]
MKDSLGIAVVGYGQTAGIHTRLLGGEGHRLAWLIGRLPERAAAFAAKHGFARHSTHLRHALQDPAVDAVVLCTPSPQHAEQAAACLAAGKHVLVEIPLAMSHAEGARLARTARDLGLTLMVAHGHRYQPALRTVRERVARGELTPHSITARYLLLRRENVGSGGYVRSWTDNLLWHHGQHSTDMVLWLLGVEEPGQVEVTAVHALPDRRLGIPMDISLTLKTRRDQLGIVSMSYHSRVPVYDYVLVCEEDTLVIENGVLRDRDGVLYDPRQDPTENRDSWLLQDREFAAAVRERRPPAISAESVLPALDALQRAQDAYDASLPPGATHPVFR